MLAWVACGRLSAYFEADLNAWDSAAGVLLVREAGGVVREAERAARVVDSVSGGGSELRFVPIDNETFSLPPSVS